MAVMTMTMIMMSAIMMLMRRVGIGNVWRHCSIRCNCVGPSLGVIRSCAATTACKASGQWQHVSPVLDEM
eukprot:10467375-Karenia_brevis.AAC.1